MSQSVQVASAAADGVFIGVDWGNFHHQLCVLDPAGRVVAQGRFAHDVAGDWLEANPRVHVHFTPTSASWMNLVEVLFGIIERQAIHRGTFGSVRYLTA